ncbi:MAG: diguanylate cyclase [Candidatus Wallbacteria bacterium]|nr:diguanylate cyclase [Candidatus Wallbacteria bacterium]
MNTEKRADNSVISSSTRGKIPFYSSIKLKTLLGIFIIAVTPLVILGVYSFNTLAKLSQDLMITTNLQAVQQVKTEVDNFVSHYMTIMNFLKKDKRLESGNTGQISAAARQIDEEFEFIERIIVTGMDGRVMGCSTEGTPELTVNEEKLLTSQDEFYFSQGKWLFKVRAGDQNNALIIATVSFFELRKSLDRIAVGTTFMIFLVTREGDNILETKDFPLELINRMIREPYGAYDINFGRNEITQVAVVLPLLHYGLKVIVTQEAKEIYSLVTTIKRNVKMAILLAGILAILSGIFFSLQITSPIIFIAGKVNEISDGNLSVRLNLPRKDEIGFLAGCIDNMAEKILKKIFELSALFQISQIISHSSGYQEVLDKILTQLIKLFGARRGSIMLLSDKNDLLKLTSVKLFRSEDGSIMSGELKEQIEIKYGEGIAGQVVKTGIPVLSVDCSKDPRFKQYVANSNLKPPRTLISVPLVVKDKPFGVINLSDRTDNSSFTASDMELLLTISTQMAISLDNSKLYELAIRDGLTGLYIYRYFQIRLDEEIVRARRYKDPLTLIMVDIDHFKNFNDKFGHQQGDIVLREVAGIIQATARATDIACRYGGEEFGVILPNTAAEQAMILAERLRKKVESYPFPGQDNPLHVTISLGLAEYPKMAGDKGGLISHADIALYSSKSCGRNRTSLYDEDMGDVMEEKNES